MHRTIQPNTAQIESTIACVSSERLMNQPAMIQFIDIEQRMPQLVSANVTGRQRGIGLADGF